MNIGLCIAGIGHHGKQQSYDNFLLIFMSQWNQVLC